MLDEYKEFSRKFGLPEQRERIYADLRGRVAPSQRTYQKWQAEQADKAAKRAAQKECKAEREQRQRSEAARRADMDKAAKSGIMKISNAKEEIQVHLVGKIDREIYKCITADIVTDEVIITDERIEHIKERHPSDYKMVIEHMTEAIRNPDYILNDERANTGLIIKSLHEDNIQVVLRIHTSKDEAGYKNSIISCWRISKRRLLNYLRNKEILYKKE